MQVNELLVPLVTFGGAGLVGFFAGWALRKVIGIVLKIAAIVLGLFFVGLIWLESNGWSKGYDYDKIGNDVYGLANQTVASINTSPFMDWISTANIAAVSGLGVGFFAGFVRGGK